MNHICWLVLFVPMLTAAADWYVDDDNQAGSATGTVMAPFTRIQDAINAAASGDTVKVASGIYAENLTIADKSLTLQSAFPGGSDADYAGGMGGDFTIRYDDHSAHIQGPASAPVILISGESGATTIDGFHISGGQRGIALPDWPVLSDMAILNNRIENNGLTDPAPEFGGGIYAPDSDNLSIEGNLITGNRAGDGAGVGAQGTNMRVRDNRVIGNNGNDDHGGGLYLIGTGEVRDNEIADNRISHGTDAYGWGGGLVIYGPGTEMTVAGNRITGNYSDSPGGGVFIDDGAVADFNHNLVANNSSGDNVGAGLYVDRLDESLRSTARIDHSTIANNGSTGGTGNGIFIQTSDVTVTNSIFWNNGGDDFAPDASSLLAIDYSLSQESGAGGTGNLVGQNPLFADAANGDFHLQSSGGRWDGDSGQWIIDSTNSPGIDTANPTSPFASETAPNGARANLGAYGNTAEASRSVGGATEVSLSVSVQGPGMITSDPAGVQCPDTCIASFPINEAVTLTANPAPDALFTAWGGSCTGSEPECELVMSAARSVSASFESAHPDPTAPIIEYLDASDQQVSVISTIDRATRYLDFGGQDRYVLPVTLAGSVTIVDNQASTLYLPAGMTVEAALFAADGMRFTIDGHHLTVLGRPQDFTFVFAGRPDDPSVGVARDFVTTAMAFGASVPTVGQAPVAGNNLGVIHADGSVGDGGGEPVAAGLCGAAEGQLFGADYPWNQRIDNTPLDAESTNIIQFLQTNHSSGQRFRIDGPSDEPNNTYGITILSADASTPREAFTPSEDHYSPDCDTAPVPIPVGGAIEGESGYACENDGDCHLIVTDADACRLYEMWRANREAPGQFEGGCLAVWDLNAAYAPELRGEYCTSADAAGLPIAAHMFGADDIAAGTIKHAIRFVLPNNLMRERIYVRPATHSTSATSGPADAPPYGARLRLKADFDMSRLNAPAQVVARALQEYGMILSDGGNITFTALNDRFTEHTWVDVGLGPNDLMALEWTDFEVVELGERYPWDGDCPRTPITN